MGPPPTPNCATPAASPLTRRATCSSPTVDNNVIREVVKATGEIITVAGDRTDGYSGDGGLATAAELDVPLRRRPGPGGRPVHRRHAQRQRSARWSRRPALSRPSPATVPPATAATADPPPPPSCTSPSASCSTRRATCSSPTPTTTRSARWSRRPATSSPSPATASRL